MAAESNSIADRTELAQSCCSAFYEQDWVRALAEESFHPGGADLTRRTVNAMNLPANSAVLDLGCGTGTTSILVDREFDYVVAGVDISAANIERAKGRPDSDGVCFEQANAHSLPFGDGDFDGVVAECVFSLLTDKPAALAEMRRILKPGGRLGLTDMAIGNALPADMAETIAPWTCLSDAYEEKGYRSMFTDAGFDITEFVDESDGLDATLRSIKRKLLLAGTGAFLAGAAIDLGTIKYWLGRFAAEVANGTIRYLRFQLQA